MRTQRWLGTLGDSNMLVRRQSPTHMAHPAYLLFPLSNGDLTFVFCQELLAPQDRVFTPVFLVPSTHSNLGAQETLKKHYTLNYTYWLKILKFKNFYSIYIFLFKKE